MRRIRWVLVSAALAALLLPGCGGCTVERDKNSDLDRPKATSRK